MLNLGTQTGSLVNHIASRCIHPDIQVGMGATLLSWTDRHPATVTEHYTKGVYEYVVVQSDDYQCVMYKDELQSYTYHRNCEAETSTFRRKPNTGWQGVYKSRTTGRWNKCCGGLSIGEREKYYDPCF